MARVFPGGSTRVPAKIGRDLRGYLRGINTLSGVAGLITQEVMDRIAGWWIIQQRQYADEIYIQSLRNLDRLVRRVKVQFAVEAREETFNRAARASDISMRNLQYLTGGKPPSTGALKFKEGINLQGTSFRITIVDPTLLLRVLKEADRGMRQDLARLASAKFEPLIMPTLIETFEEVAAGLEDGAFPRMYLGGIVTQLLKRGRFSVTGLSPQGIIVNMYDIFTELGTSNDLRAGYHYGASIIESTSTFSTSTNRLRGKAGLFQSFNVRTSSSRVNLPYHGQALRVPSVSARYKYWLAMYKKIDYNARSVRGKNYKVRIPTDAWQKTKEARVAYWNSIGKAPQWLLLEYGQTKFKPTIPVHKEGAGTVSESGAVIPGNITNKFYTKLSILWYKIVAETWDEAWKHAQARVKEQPVSQQPFRANRGNPTNFSGDPYNDWYVSWFASAVEEREALQRAARGLRGGARRAAMNRALWDRLPVYYKHSSRKQNPIGGLD